MSDKPKPPIATFYRLIGEAAIPQRADRSAAGTIPMRAVRYCDAITSATGYGWHIFPAMSFSLLWDGTEIFWTYGGISEWLPLDAVQYPGMVAKFDSAAPEPLRGYSPPFLTALPEPGTVQVWSGLIARTIPDWSLLVRPLANYPRSGGFELYEGIVETDRWFGPLFSNLRLTRTHTRIDFSADKPLAQLQPMPRFVYTDDILNSISYVDKMESFEKSDWDDYRRDIVEPNKLDPRGPGLYATDVRRRRKSGCPMMASMAVAKV